MYLLLIALGLHATLAQESETKYGLACENGPITLECPSGQVIDIISASYGRTNAHTCPNAAVSNQNCAADSTQFIVSNSCNDKPKCTVYASYEIFGDPCLGTYKYMDVRYKCVQSNIQTAVSCESLPINLSCPSGKVLNIVKTNYGRTDTVTCSNPNMSNKNCYAAGSTQIAGKMYVPHFLHSIYFQ
ncbi:Calcium-independent receptor for alpha-latrotoxin [Carabus blaptoides fortunei]